MSSTEKYMPNHIPKKERVFNIVWALVLFFIAYYGFTNESFYLPGRGSSTGVSLTGDSLWIFLSAALVGAVNLLVNVVDHYDKRDNELRYKQISRVLSAIAVILAVSAVTLAYDGNRKEPEVIKNVS